MSEDKLIFYVASSNEKISHPSEMDEAAGIYVCALNPTDGSIEIVDTENAVDVCQYICLSPDQTMLYATRFHSNSAPGESSSVNSFSVDAATGKLTALNTQKMKDNSPCYVYVDDSGQNVLTVNYNSQAGRGSVQIFGRNADGTIGDLKTYRQHDGSSINQARQQESHPHMIVTDPSNNVVLVPDLGTDHVWLYTLDHSSGGLTPHDPPRLPIHAGGGPRHVAFHPNSRYLYVINELDSTITAFNWGDGFEEIQSVPAVPADFDGDSYCADIHVAPSGRFVYGSNRGHNSLVICDIDPATGMMSNMRHQSTLGNWPRGFTLTPSGDYAIVANQRSHTVVSFKVNQDTGDLTETGHQVAIPGPVGVPAFL